MATWKDGAAYAPIERPDGFATPEAEPLEVAVPQRANTPGPLVAPRGFQPTGQAVPLEAIASTTVLPRNPTVPFSSSTTLLAPDQGPDGERDPRKPFAVSATGPDLPPPSGPPLLLGPDGSPSTLPPPAPGTQLPAPADAPTGPGLPGPHPGYRYASPVSSQPANTQMQKLALGVLGAGVFLWPAATLLLMLGGLITLRVPHQKSIGSTAIWLGASWMVLGWLAPFETTALSAVTCLVILVVLLATYRAPRRR